MERALVIGASGGFGQAVARDLLARGWEVRALRRAAGRPLALAGLRQIEGDAFDREAVRRAAEGVGVIVHAYNAPYPRWRTELLPPARNVAEAAIDNAACIVLPGNVYGLGPDFSRPLRETDPRQAPTRKGRLRNELEAELEQATVRGARLLNVRCGDYMGPNAKNTWFHFLTEKAIRGGALLDPCRGDIAHEWAYLPDVARATGDLLIRRAELSPNETFHFSSYQLSSRELLAAINEALPEPRPIRRMPWTLLRLITPFSPLLREVHEMKYLWDQPVLLDDRKLSAFLGKVQHTPLAAAVRACLGLAVEQSGFGRRAAMQPAAPDAAL
jgi:nucleoside-diphosphate-sugar epimerase